MNDVKTIILGVIASLISAALVAAIAWGVRTWIVPDPVIPRPKGRIFRTLTELIDYYADLRREYVRAQQARKPTVYVRTVTVYRSRESEDSTWPIVISLIAVLFLSALWQQYKFWIYGIILALSVAGFATSLYFGLRTEAHVQSQECH